MEDALSRAARPGRVCSSRRRWPARRTCVGRGVSETSAPSCAAAPERGSLTSLRSPVPTLPPLLVRAQAPTCAESVTWTESRSAARASLGPPWPTATRRPRACCLPSAGRVVTAPQALPASLCAQQVRMVRCLVPHLPALSVCLTLVQLLSPCSADFAVVGPPEPILAMVGGDAELPCHLSPKRSAETMELMWVRPSRRQVVLTYAHGQEDTPAEEYRGRTSVLREDVTAGTAALRIRNVTASDNGTYVCYFQDGDFYAKAQVELQVAALGSNPHIEMKGYKAGGIRVNCRSAGWYPQPQVEWRDARGQNLSSEAVGGAVDPQGLYAASSSVILEEGSWEGVTCVIRNPLLGQERSAGLSIPDPYRNSDPWRTLFLVPMVVLVLLVVLSGVSYCLWRRQKRIQAPSQEKGREHDLREQRLGQSCSGWEAPQRCCRTSSSQGGTLPTDSEHGQPAASGDSTPLLEHQDAARVPSEDSGAKLQEVVLAGGEASPEQALQTQVAPGTRTRLGQEPSVPQSSHEQGLLRIRARGSQTLLEDDHKVGRAGGEQHRHL